MAERSDKKAAETPDFEKSLARLEEIVRAMEGGELSLDRMIAHFEEGSTLVKACTRKLDEVERKIEQLVTQDGKDAVKPFAEPGEEPGSA